MIKYRTRWSDKIEIVTVDRETENSIWSAGQRSAKRSSYANYWDSWTEAHHFLLEKAEQEVNYARMKLERVKGTFGNIKGMKEPV
jgi:hypothetical protein